MTQMDLSARAYHRVLKMDRQRFLLIKAVGPARCEGGSRPGRYGSRQYVTANPHFTITPTSRRA